MCGSGFTVTVHTIMIFLSHFLMTGTNLDVMLSKCVRTMLWYLFDRHLELTGSGVYTASGIVHYDGLAERDITFILFASQ